MSGSMNLKVGNRKTATLFMRLKNKMGSPTKDISKFQDKEGLLLGFDNLKKKRSNYPPSFENLQTN